MLPQGARAWKLLGWLAAQWVFYGSLMLLLQGLHVHERACVSADVHERLITLGNAGRHGGELEPPSRGE